MSIFSRLGSMLKGSGGAGPAAPKSDPASGKAKPAEDAPAEAAAEDMKEIRAHLRTVGSAIAFGLGALLTGLGYTQVHKLFPLPHADRDWAVPLAIASSAAALLGAALLMARFYGAQRRIPVSTDPDERPWWGFRTPLGLWPKERMRRDRVFLLAARDEEAESLQAVELRALRLQRIARQTGGSQRQELEDEAKRLLDAVDLTLTQGASAVLERRAHQAFGGVLTRVFAVLTIAGIIGIFGLADWSQGERDRVALGKQCVEAKKPIPACKSFGVAGGAGAAESTTAEKSGWLNGYTETVLATPRIEYRVYGGESGRIGSWVTPAKPADAASARNVLALPDENSAQCMVRVRVPAGAKVQVGHVAPLFHHPGGAVQLKIVSPLTEVVYSADQPLPPSRGPCP